MLLCYYFTEGADEMPRIIPIEGLKTLPQYLKTCIESAKLIYLTKTDMRVYYYKNWGWWKNFAVTSVYKGLPPLEVMCNICFFHRYACNKLQNSTFFTMPIGIGRQYQAIRICSLTGGVKIAEAKKCLQGISKCEQISGGKNISQKKGDEDFSNSSGRKSGAYTQLHPANGMSWTPAASIYNV